MKNKQYIYWHANGNKKCYTIQRTEIQWIVLSSLPTSGACWIVLFNLFIILFIHKCVLMNFLKTNFWLSKSRLGCSPRFFPSSDLQDLFSAYLPVTIRWCVWRIQFWCTTARRCHGILGKWDMIFLYPSFEKFYKKE